MPWLDRALLPGVAAAVAFGCAFGALVVLPPWVVVVSLGPLALAVSRRSVLSLWAAAFVVGLALAARPPAVGSVAGQIPLLDGIVGRVVGMPDPGERWVSFTIQPQAIPARLLVYLPRGEQPAVRPGDLVRLWGAGDLPEDPGWRDYLARRGIQGLFWAEEAELVEEGRASPLRWAVGVRAALLTRLTDVLPPAGGRLVGALLLGARRLLPDELEAAFRAAGAAHLLALSGLHLGILVAGGWWLLGLVRIPTTWRYLLLLPAVGAYVLVGGLRVSLIRAAAMFAVLGWFWVLWERGLVLRRWRDPLQGLALAAVMVLVVWPWSALDAGFQLSFAATGAIILFLPRWLNCPLRRRLPGPVLRAADLVAVGACAQVGAVPIVGSVFGYLALYGLVANPILIPWTGFILWAGIGLLAIAPLPWAPAIGQAVHGLVIAPYLRVVAGLAQLPGAVVATGPQFGLWCAACALGVALLRAIADETGVTGRPPSLPGRSLGPAWWG
ncbi:MAG: ComEC/Rec2 family competence protein [Candidatus Bipolaricaulaceae bacterium]